jgi:hypothetical protein
MLSHDETADHTGPDGTTGALQQARRPERGQQALLRFRLAGQV